MAQVGVRPSSRATAKLKERETRLVREAIAMVAMGASSRVTVAGIRFGHELLDGARRDALAASVRVYALARLGEAGVDVVVEPIRE
jgi:hypothetical protein